jgi:formylglycine-generating enzyme required for sulfatase activity
VLDMVDVPAGRFTMGASDGEDDERPVRTESVDGFSIGRTETTVADYRRCEAAHACTPTAPKANCNEGVPGREKHPINCVTAMQAAAFCAWAGARLPTEREWEYAGRGTDGRRYPWGNAAPNNQLCWDGVGSDRGRGKRTSTCPVGSYTGGASPFGALDMAGNVWEWTSDVSTDHSDVVQMTRGGTWFTYDALDVRMPLRMRVYPGAKNFGIGFRCARSAET